MKFKITYEVVSGDPWYVLYQWRWFGWQRVTGSQKVDVLKDHAKQIARKIIFYVEAK